MAPFAKKQLIKLGIRTGIIVALAAIHVFVFLQGADGVSREIFETRAQTLALSQLQDKKNKLTTEYDDVVNAIFLLDDAIPDGENPLRFRRILDDLALNTGNSQSFTFKTSLPQASASIPTVRVIPYVITLEGNLDSFIAYLNELQKLHLFIAVDSLILSGEGFNTMSISARIFVR